MRKDTSVRQYIHNQMAFLNEGALYESFDKYHQQISPKSADVVNWIKANTDKYTFSSINGQLAFYNELEGVWLYGDDQIDLIIEWLAPYITPVSKNAVRNKLLFEFSVYPDGEYTGSRYLLFANGVLDVKKDKLFDLSDDKVKNLRFTRKHRLDLDYNPRAQVSTHLKNWVNSHLSDPSEMNQRYFLMLLALGLFPGHNFGVNVSIKGPSGSGKSTLGDVLGSIYHRSDALCIGDFSQLNTQFPLNNFKDDSAVVWLKENNVNSDVLNAAYGVPFYDKMTDSAVNIPVKHHEDIVLQNPMTMYVDGTRLILAEDMNTGVARRTMVFVFPDDESLREKDPYRIQRQKYNIRQLFQDSSNYKKEDLQAFVKLMVEAYRDFFMAKNKRETLQDINISNVEYLYKDPNLVSEEYRDQRNQMLSASDRITDFLENYVLPFVTPDTKLHTLYLYQIYLKIIASTSKTGRDTSMAKSYINFERDVRKSLVSLGYDLIEIGKPYTRGSSQRTYYRMAVQSVDDTGFDFTELEKDIDLPDTLTINNTAYNHMGLFGKRQHGWFEIRKI